MRGKPINSQLYNYKGTNYPNYIKHGDAYQYIEPFALQFCKGRGLDIGGLPGRCLKGSIPVNIDMPDFWSAFKLPPKKYNYIFSSHTLEHLSDYVGALRYWREHLKPRGVMFLYLPSHYMEYWLPQNNSKHLHFFTPEMIVKVLEDLGFPYVLSSERDLYWSFSVVGILN